MLVWAGGGSNAPLRQHNNQRMRRDNALSNYLPKPSNYITMTYPLWGLLGTVACVGDSLNAPIEVAKVEFGRGVVG